MFLLSSFLFCEGDGRREGERHFQGFFGGRGGPDGISILILIPSSLPKSQQPTKEKKTKKIEEK